MLINVIVDLTLKSNSEVFLNNTFKEIYKDKLEYSNLFPSNIIFEKNSKYNIKFSVLNIDTAIKVNYNIKEPLDFIFENNIFEKYDEIFKFIFKLNLFQSVLSRCFLDLKNYKRNNVIIILIIFLQDKRVLRIIKIFNKTYNLIKSIHTFFINNVQLIVKCIQIIYNLWNDFMNISEVTLDIEELRTSQNAFLDEIIVIISDNPQKNISYKIIVLINKLFLKICQFYLKV